MLGCDRPAAVRASRRKRSRDSTLGGEVRRQQLDRDQAVQGHVAREEHDAHAAATQLALDRVAARQHLLEGEELGAEPRGHGEKVTPGALSSAAGSWR